MGKQESGISCWAMFGGGVVAIVVSVIILLWMPGTQSPPILYYCFFYFVGLCYVLALVIQVVLNVLAWLNRNNP